MLGSGEWGGGRAGGGERVHPAWYGMHAWNKPVTSGQSPRPHTPTNMPVNLLLQPPKLWFWLGPLIAIAVLVAVVVPVVLLAGGSGGSSSDTQETGDGESGGDGNGGDSGGGGGGGGSNTLPALAWALGSGSGAPTTQGTSSTPILAQPQPSADAQFDITVPPFDPAVSGGSVWLRAAVPTPPSGAAAASLRLVFTSKQAVGGVVAALSALTATVVVQGSGGGTPAAGEWVAATVALPVAQGFSATAGARYGVTLQFLWDGLVVAEAPGLTLYEGGALVLRQKSGTVLEGTDPVGANGKSLAVGVPVTSNLATGALLSPLENVRPDMKLELVTDWSDLQTGVVNVATGGSLRVGRRLTAAAAKAGTAKVLEATGAGAFIPVTTTELTALTAQGWGPELTTQQVAALGSDGGGLHDGVPDVPDNPPLELALELTVPALAAMGGGLLLAAEVPGSQYIVPALTLSGPEVLGRTATYDSPALVPVTTFVGTGQEQSDWWKCGVRFTLSAPALSFARRAELELQLYGPDHTKSVPSLEDAPWQLQAPMQRPHWVDATEGPTLQVDWDLYPAGLMHASKLLGNRRHDQNASWEKQGGSVAVKYWLRLRRAVLHSAWKDSASRAALQPPATYDDFRKQRVQPSLRYEAQELVVQSGTLQIKYPTKLTREMESNIHTPLRGYTYYGPGYSTSLETSFIDTYALRKDPVPELYRQLLTGADRSVAIGAMGNNQQGQCGHYFFLPKHNKTLMPSDVSVIQLDVATARRRPEPTAAADRVTTVRFSGQENVTKLGPGTITAINPRIGVRTDMTPERKRQFMLLNAGRQDPAGAVFPVYVKCGVGISTAGHIFPTTPIRNLDRWVPVTALMNEPSCQPVHLTAEDGTTTFMPLLHRLVVNPLVRLNISVGDGTWNLSLPNAYAAFAVSTWPGSPAVADVDWSSINQRAASTGSSIKYTAGTFTTPTTVDLTFTNAQSNTTFVSFVVQLADRSGWVLVTAETQSIS